MNTHHIHAHLAANTIQKVGTGITGFDEITEGGLPQGRTTLVTGGPGSGKTVFALQTLVHGARQSKEPGIFVTFEECSRQWVANASAFGWDLPGLEKQKLFFLDAGLTADTVKAGAFDLAGMLEILEHKAKAMSAKRIVFDGVDVLLELLGDPALERQEVYRIRDWLNRTGLTGVLTAKVGGPDPEAERRYGFMQFMVDCVVALKHQVLDGAAFRSLRVVKFRGSSFQADEFPVTLNSLGMQLTNRGPVELKYAVSNERVSSGLPRLDTMLCGGYHRGSSVLISGAPGAAKSTLAAAFALAACLRKERTLYVSFDEGAAQIVRNMASVGIHLGPHEKSGVLRLYSTRTRGPNVDKQFADLRSLVLQFQPRCLVVDPLSALSGKMAHLASEDAGQQFLDFLKVQGITVVSTSLMGDQPTEEHSTSGISTVSDTWIQLSYVVQEGERNRALTIVKSRGTGHSNQVRELKLSGDGVTLADVFVAHGRVLMGVARWEWEQQELAQKVQLAADSRLKRLRLEIDQAEARARLTVIETEMRARAAEMDALAQTAGFASDVDTVNQAVLRTMRRGDAETPEPVATAPVTTKPRRSRRP